MIKFKAWQIIVIVILGLCSVCGVCLVGFVSLDLMGFLSTEVPESISIATSPPITITTESPTDVPLPTPEEIEAITGGKFAYEEDPIKTAKLMIDHINKKRAALRLQPMIYENK